ncbi:AroM family protein [Candidatus Bathyarchaeota archaeon]|jgi:protein AroM|nr:AroM family protein [Candidatus Bathyarchaeota archaeon]MBT4423836.1 AroM family protein [Candidatus Bathyarchaeota archaeon]MBT6605695.1 AroM family protein [Candidatus Bathyarchaeota archaeon]MBT7187085.1 AroM family protein [Candidatus Bathyarchaeota archaeon]MBT7345731.1 AroM family protein [Candidatus Bathyarchaeota archaeon]
MKKIGMLTIGQTPRDDLIPGLMDILGPEYEIVEAGALDDHTLEDVNKIDLNPDHYILVSRMRDGTEIKITKEYVVPQLQEQLDKLEAQGVRLTVVMCTGKFPQFRSKGIVLTPSEVLRGVLQSSIKKGKLAVVYPTAEQMPYAERDFGREGVEVYADIVSPYENDDVKGLLDRLVREEPDLVFLNCFGFPYSIKRQVQEATGKTTIHSSALIARVLKELSN